MFMEATARGVKTVKAEAAFNEDCGVFQKGSVMKCIDCGIIFHPNGPKQTKCNACRFPNSKGYALQWRMIPGYEGRYEMSDMADVLSLIGRRHVMKPTWTEGGFHICLSNSYGEPRTWLLHRLLLVTFRPISSVARMLALPDNGDKYDMRLSNWHWHRSEGEHASRVKLTEEDVRQIKARINADPRLTYQALATEYGVTFGTIGKIVTGRAWKHVV
jgi:hypothetical protein